jgi:glycosyltransferase involved in cell wall biosynthesis
MSSLLIVTDAWRPQTNGVVRCLEAVGAELTAAGMTVHYLTPERYFTIPLPTYPEIGVALVPPGAVDPIIDDLAPDHIHIATEGPLGLMARLACVNKGLNFTTSFHTRFPEYVAARMPVPAEWSYAYLRWFHGAAAATLVPTPSVSAELATRGLRNLVTWSRGVDTTRFSPGPKSAFTDLKGPHLLYVGRVAVEKNVEAFLELAVPGTKIVVGDGPDRKALEAAYPEAVFTGKLSGEALSAHYRSADVFVFPSRTDTFGNVMLEAMASGLPVAAYPVTGPIDVITDPEAGALDKDLGVAVSKALTLSRAAAVRHARRFTWAECAGRMAEVLVPVRTPTVRAA